MDSVPQQVADFVNYISEEKLALSAWKIAAFLKILLEGAAKCITQLTRMMTRWLGRTTMNTDDLAWTALRYFRQRRRNSFNKPSGPFRGHISPRNYFYAIQNLMYVERRNLVEVKGPRYLGPLLHWVMYFY